MIRGYAREIDEGKYPNGLAYSVHFAIEENGQSEPIHNNYGILFPKADIDENNCIVPKFVRNIRIAHIRSINQFVITGEDVLSDGNTIEETSEKLWCWLTEDFIQFEELGLIEKQKVTEMSGLTIDEIRKSDAVEISNELVYRIKTYWNPLTFHHMKENEFFYSDQSSHKKDIGNYPRLKFPLARGFGDPVILLWEDEYYFIATNDNVNDIGFYVRKAHELDDLFQDDVQMHIILDKDEKRGLIQTFWAPEFHVINGSLYILFAVSNENWGPQCHLMKLRDGGNILNPEDWMDPVKIKRADGKNIGENGITLDMTYVKSGNRHYYVWSYREHIGTSLDSGSMIMVGEFLPEKPDEIIGEPICISRPLYGFENVQGTINNEGPYALYKDGTIYLTYSGGDARGYLYTVGLLTAKNGDDLCDIHAWEKAKTPVLSFASVDGEYGPGHNSFFCDRVGNWWIAFHAVTKYEEKIISTGIRRIHFDVSGKPRFDLSSEEDFPKQYRK